MSKLKKWFKEFDKHYLKSDFEWSEQYRKKHPKKETDMYWCYIVHDDGSTEVDLYSTAQHGYEVAEERIPGFVKSDHVCSECGRDKD